MAFTFSLEAALQRRKRQEQDAQVALAGAISARGEAMMRLAELERDVNHIELAMSPLGAALDGEGRLNTLYYLERVRHAVERQRRVVAWCDGEVDRARGVVMQAAHRRSALERLRERRYDDYQQAMGRRMQNELDELVTLRYGNPAMGQQVHQETNHAR